MSDPFVIFENCIAFDMCRFLNKAYSWIINPEIFKDIIIRNHKNKKIFLFFRDGENPRLSGCISWLDQIVSEINIPKKDIIIVAYEPESEFNSEQFNPIDGSKGFISRPPPEIKINGFDKKFACMFGRFTIYRLRVLKYMHDRYASHSLLMMKDTIPEILNQLLKCPEFYQHEIAWVQRSMPLPSIGDDVPYQWPLTIDMIFNGYDKIYHRYFLDIVVETDIYNSLFVTEKISKNFFYGKPFLLLGAPGTLKNLRKMGFKTFSGMIDERYDLIENTEDRLAVILKEVERLGHHSMEELEAMLHGMKDVLDHNRSLLIEEKYNLDAISWAPTGFDSSIHLYTARPDWHSFLNKPF